jgi:hypothetical protein
MIRSAPANKASPTSARTIISSVRHEFRCSNTYFTVIFFPGVHVGELGVIVKFLLAGLAKDEGKL